MTTTDKRAAPSEKRMRIKEIRLDMSFQNVDRRDIEWLISELEKAHEALRKVEKIVFDSAEVEIESVCEDAFKGWNDSQT